MLADDRSRALVTNFAAQWLHLRNLESITPDMRLFPDFDDNLRQAFRQETELFVDSVLREDRSVLDLLRADYTFLNERLAKHYGIPHVYGSRFRRVDARRGQLAGRAASPGSILTVTSYATRTSPVLRGKWVLDNLLGAPPPPPLPDVPALKDNTVDGSLSRFASAWPSTARTPICAGCHNVDRPASASRSRSSTRSAAGGPSKPARRSTRPGGFPTAASSPTSTDWKRRCCAGRSCSSATFTEKLLTYALGRGVEYDDAPAIRTIVRDARAQNYRISSLILGVVKSQPFQMRKSR